MSLADVQFSTEWRGDNYHLLDHNCLHFCDILCVFLVLKHLPSQVMKILNVASKIPSAGKKSEIFSLNACLAVVLQGSHSSHSTPTTSRSKPSYSDSGITHQTNQFSHLRIEFSGPFWLQAQKKRNSDDANNTRI